MTVISALQPAILRVLKQRPSAVFASQDPTMMEFADLANEVATDIMKKHEWQALTRVQTVTGDGTASAFPLPDDYDRFLVATEINDPNTWFWGYYNIESVSQWLRMLTSGFQQVTPGAWIVLENELRFQPVPGAGAQAIYPYISKGYALSPTKVTQNAFASDLDSFKLEDRLLTLGVIWRYRQQKRLDYAEDMEAYEIALSEAMARDHGLAAIRSRASRPRGNFGMAWPWSLGPDTY